MRSRHFLFPLALLWSVAVGAAPHGDYAPQVVELSITAQRYNARRPWAKSKPGTRSAMAVVVDGPLLLTSAQMAGDATLIQVTKFGRPPKVPVRVVHVDPEINLALLAVEDPGFFDDLESVKLSDSIPTEGSVRSMRWKNGQLEVSTSRVARVEVDSTRTSDLEHVFLRVKSDLAGGGWVEPVFADDRLVGLTVSQAEDRANVLPAALIEAYLAAVRKEGDYRGFGNLGVVWRANRDRALAAYLGLDGEPRGVLILQVPWGSSGCGVLEPRDLLLALDGREIDPAGFYEHVRYGRLRFTQIALDGHLAGDVLPARVLRKGEILDLNLELRRYPTSALLIPWRQRDRAPPYLVAGGLVFRELDVDYLASWGTKWKEKADTRLIAFWEMERQSQTPERRRMIILMYVLPDAYNIGYHNLANLAVHEVNGLPVDSIADLDEGFRRPDGDSHRIVLYPNPVRDDVVVDAATFESATASILKNYGIPERMRLDPESPPDPTPPCPDGL